MKRLVVLVMSKKWWIGVTVVVLLFVSGFLYVTRPWLEPLHSPGWYIHNTPGQPDLSAPDRFGPRIEREATTDKSSYLLDEDIVIEFSFKNSSSEPFQIDPFPPFIEIMRPRPYEPVRSFPAGTDIKSLDPGEVASYAVTWDQRDDRGQQVDYGYYQFRVHPDTGRLDGVLILPPEGVMEKTVQVNESQTVNGITITLEWVELSASEAKFHAFNTLPPGYSSSRDSTAAEYRLDGGPVKDAGTAGIHFLENRMAYTWEQLDPVAKGTKELTFVITRLGDWEGPWEFHISLE